MIKRNSHLFKNKWNEEDRAKERSTDEVHPRKAQGSESH